MAELRHSGKDHRIMSSSSLHKNSAGGSSKAAIPATTPPEVEDSTDDEEGFTAIVWQDDCSQRKGDACPALWGRIAPPIYLPF